MRPSALRLSVNAPISVTPWACRIDVSRQKVEPELFRKAELKGNVDLDSFETKQVGCEAFLLMGCCSWAYQERPDPERCYRCLQAPRMEPRYPSL